MLMNKILLFNDVQYLKMLELLKECDVAVYSY